MLILGAICAAPSVAKADCTLNYPRAVACLSSKAAAEAWRVLGRDPHALDKDYVRAVFTQARCAAFANVADPGEPILKVGSAHLPTLEGWIDVTFVRVRSRKYGGTAVWIASDYLTGECTPAPAAQ
jgi:hypothetical protein